MASKNQEKLSAAVTAVKQLGKEALTYAVDVADDSQAESLVDQVTGKFGRIDILVNCSDLRFARAFIEMTKEEWQRVMDVNLSSVYNCCKAIGRQMLKQTYGRIINISSCLAERGLVNSTAYCASAGAVLQLTRALALEWAREGITVNAIGAGWMAEEETTGTQEEEQLLRYIPLGRYGHPSEISSLPCYMASDAASFFTSEFVTVDGAVMNRLF